MFQGRYNFGLPKAEYQFPPNSARDPGENINQAWASESQPQDFCWKYQPRGILSLLELRTEAWGYLATSWEARIRMKRSRTK